tara:strand:+ start:98470 stop:100035 length:1566 start_codon:yes stop_codon:yes gene_type:complete
MAEVFLARQEGIGGFEKLVALKRIYPHLIHDASFIEMFLAEARIAASLEHPKIVQILDIERDEDGLFIVMEYLAGESLSYILKELDVSDAQIPPAIACRIGADVATGLHAAHSALDSEGQPRCIVHRDVTPSNILVTFRGGVKVLDFGVAKAVKRTTTTDKNVLKGKTSYLSPELIAGDAIDARADIFQLGIVVHEMLTGRRLFSGNSVPTIIQSITEAKVAAPSTVASGLPASLDRVVLKALSRDPADRFQTAEEFALALDAEARSLGEPVSERQLGRWMHSTFPDRVEQKLRWRQTALDRQDDAEENTPVHIVESTATASQPTVRVGVGNPLADRDDHATRATAFAPPKIAGAVLVVFALLAAGYFTFRRKPKVVAPTIADAQIAIAVEAPVAARDARPAPRPTPLSHHISITVLPPTATIELDGEIVGQGDYSAILDMADHELRLAADGYLPQRLTISPAHPAPNVVRLQRIDKATPPEAAPGTPREVSEKQQEPQTMPVERKTKPFGSDNLNPWEPK